MVWIGPLLVVLGAFLWGVSGGLGGMLIDRGWDPLLAAFYRGATGFGFVLVWLLSQPRKNLPMDRYSFAWSLLGGIGVAGNLAFYLLSIPRVGVAVAVTLMYMAPIYVYLVAFFTGVERSTWLRWLAIGLAMLGILLLTNVFATGLADLDLLGILSGLLSGLCYALFILVFKRAAARGGRPQSIMTVSLLVFALAMVPFVSYQEVIAASLSPDVTWFVLTGLLGAGIAFPVYFVGLRTTSPAIAAIIAMIEPITASFMGVLLLGESLSALQLTGVALVLVPVTLLSTRRI